MDPTKIVLSRSSFSFSPGLTFLVGRSGSGKSTITNLLLKFYEPLTGTILIDGQSIRTLDDKWLRENVTLIQQSSILFNDTFFMNVAFGSRDPFRVTREEVRAACETVLLQSTVASLPEGLDTNVGIGGHNLSGGQRQRLALARARLRDPPVLILDEVTSGLDAISRVLILEAIRVWRAGKTTIIITHDVTQILDKDYVYVLDQSFLVQQGIRSDLVKEEDGIFASLLSSTDSEPARDSTLHSSPGSLPKTTSAKPSRLSKVFLPQRAPSSTGNRGLFRLSLGPNVEQSTIIKLAEPRHGRASYPHPKPELPSRPVPLEPKTSVRVRDGLGHNSNRTRKSSLDMALLQGEVTKSRRPLVKSPRVTQDSEPTASGVISPCEETPSGCGQRKQHKEKPVAVGAGKDLSVAKIIATVWPMLDRANRARIVLGIAACMVAAACNPVFSFLFAQLIAALWAPPAEMRAAGQTWAVRLTIVGVVDGCATFAAFYLMQCAGQAWVTSLRVEALKRILSQPKQWFDNPSHSPGRLASVLDRDAEEMRNLVGRFVPVILIVVTMMTSGLIWALAISWRLTLVTLASAPAVYAATQAIASVSGKWEARCNAMAEATGSVSVETFLNIRVVRALTLEHHFSSKHTQSTESTFRVGARRGLWTGFFYGLNQAMPDWLTALVFWYATVLLTSPGAAISASNIVQVINLLLFSIGTATAMLDSIPQIAHAKATSIQVLYYAALSYSSGHEGRGEVRVLTPFPVEMKALQFAYPAAKGSREGPNKVLRNVNLRIDRGDCVGIVGASGCGKSTIANLLLRLYEPSADQQSEGSMQYHASHRHHTRRQNQKPAALSYAGVPASDISTSILRTHTAYVPQHPFLFPTTIRENIAYGLHADSPFRELSFVVAAARLAHIHDFIVSLPEGYSTLVGEGGLGLSGGQAQRVSIARAFVRKPKLLVLDEPTSSLDADGAEDVRKAIQGLMDQSRQDQGGGELTIVAITHSKEMMRIVSRIVVMDDGFVAEEGGFEELLARGDKFAGLLGGGAWVPPDEKKASMKGGNLRLDAWSDFTTGSPTFPDNHGS
ncbi:ATP-dependent permease [Diaporthe eres]